MMRIKGWRKERRENRVNRSGSGEPAGSRTVIKGPQGPVFSFQTPLSLSKFNLEREALPSLLKETAGNWKSVVEKMKLHLLRRELTHRRGGCRPNRAAPPRRKIQTSPFSKQIHFSNILFA